MVTMARLCHSSSVMLSVMLLLVLMTPEFSSAHSPKYIKKGGSRIRRSATPSDADVPHNATNGFIPEVSGPTQVPQTSAELFVTQASNATKNASDTQDHPTIHANTEAHSNMTANITARTYPTPNTVSTQSSGGLPKTTSKTTIKPLSTSVGSASSLLETNVTSHPSNASSPSVTLHTSDLDKASSDSTSTPTDTSQSSHVEPPTSTTQPTLPVKDSTPDKSHPFLTTHAVYTNASTASSNASVPGHTTVSGASGDSERMTTTEHMPTSGASSSSAIGLHPRPHPKVTTAAATTTSKSPPLTQRKSDCPVFTQSPSKKTNLVGACLIAIASLAGLATFFMVCSIILCTKLAAAKHRYRVRMGGEGTEMVCISALLPDGDGPMRPKTPKSNGALIPITDTDSDYGDNLTLNSFLPDGDNRV